MATPAETANTAATSLGMSICASPIGALFPSLCLAGIGYDRASEAAASAAASGSSIVGDIGDETEDVIRATAEPLVAVGDIARWTTIGIIAIAVCILALIALFLFFYLRGFR